MQVSQFLEIKLTSREYACSRDESLKITAAMDANKYMKNIHNASTALVLIIYRPIRGDIIQLPHTGERLHMQRFGEIAA